MKSGGYTNGPNINFRPPRPCVVGERDQRAMQPQPRYTSGIKPAYQLRYNWTGWPSSGSLPPLPSGEPWEAALAGWESDGVRFLECGEPSDSLQLVCSVRPDVSPELFTSRVKGRLQHAYRQAGTPVAFSRKVAFRGIGDNTSQAVLNYVRDQLNRADLADPRYMESMRTHHHHDPECRLDEPVETERGRYWYNLHLVLVVAGRYRMGSEDMPPKIHDACLGTARKHGYYIAEMSVMPDHLHLALKGNPAESPECVALAFMNNTAYKLGLMFWENGYYVGTFGEYTMRAVRSREASSPTARGRGGRVEGTERL